MDAVICTNCISGKSEELVFRERDLVSRRELEETRNSNLFLGPGLMDLQVNGINGVDFNTPSLREEDFQKAARYLLSQGITTFFPTVITNSDDNLLTILRAIHSACLSDPLVNDCVGGVHLEGPFISPVPGARGVHDEAYIQPPDWEVFSRYQEAAGGKIKLITLAPEWEGSTPFIQRCRDQKNTGGHRTLHSYCRPDPHCRESRGHLIYASGEWRSLVVATASQYHLGSTGHRGTIGLYHYRRYSSSRLLY